MILKLACQIRKNNHNHKGNLGCVPGLFLKRYHKTSKLVQIIYHLACVLSEIIERWNKRHPNTIKYRCSLQWETYSQNLENGW